VLLFFHGGGYIGYATPAHLKYQFALQKAIRDAGFDLSIFSASYSLAPSQRYPVQLNEAADILRYLLETAGRKAETVLVGGDSAGGNLATAVLLHLARPHGKVPELKVRGRLKGAVLISPWICFDTGKNSFSRNEKSDYLTVTSISRASRAFIGPGAAFDEYSEPVRVEPAFWKDVAGVVDEVLVWGGGGEVLVDGIRTFAKRIEDGFADASGERQRVSYIEMPHAAHEEQIMNYTLRLQKSESATFIEEWICSRLEK